MRTRTNSIVRIIDTCGCAREREGEGEEEGERKGERQRASERAREREREREKDRERERHTQRKRERDVLHTHERVREMYCTHTPMCRVDPDPPG